MSHFNNISAADRPLHGIFITIPHRYDLINTIITWGLDKGWRNGAVKECLSGHPARVLDLCCGTGDLIITIARRAGHDVELTGLDYSKPMLHLATKKAEHLATGRRILFIQGDAARLPFPDGYFDCIGISFAFRNLTYRNPLAQRHLNEVFRILKTGGRFVIVESSQPKLKLIQKALHFYLRWFVFGAGYLLSGNRVAYHYLSESVAHFFTPEEVKEMLLRVGFLQVSYRPLFLGAAGIHVATK